MNKPRLSFAYLPHAMVSAAFLSAFVFYYFMAESVLRQSDMAWHIAAGDFIRKTGSVPMNNPWAQVGSEAPWYNLSWLWDLLLSALKDSAGYAGIYFFSAFLLAAVVGLLAYSLLQRSNVKDYAACLVLFLSGAVLWNLSNPRPQLASFFLIVLFHLLLDQSRKGGKSYRLLYCLPPLMALWVNLHGMFVVGFSMGVAYMVEAYVTKNTPWLKQLAVAGILTGLALFANPYGIDIIPGIMRTLDTPVKDYIQEWFPFTFFAQLLPSVFILVFILVSNSRDKDVAIADKILSFLWLFAALLSVRNIAIFVLVSSPYLAYQLSCVGKPQEFPDFSKPLLRPRFFAFACVCVVVMLLPVSQKILLHKDVAMENARLADDSIGFITEHYPDKIMLNSYGLGGQALLFSNGTLKPFMDGRAGTAYSDAVQKDYLDYLMFENGWEYIVDKHHIELILADNSDAFVREYGRGQLPRWERVFQGKISSVYLRK